MIFLETKMGEERPFWKLQGHLTALSKLELIISTQRAVRTGEKDFHPTDFAKDFNPVGLRHTWAGRCFLCFRLPSLFKLQPALEEMGLPGVTDDANVASWLQPHLRFLEN